MGPTYAGKCKKGLFEDRNQGANTQYFYRITPYNRFRMAQNPGICGVFRRGLWGIGARYGRILEAGVGINDPYRS